MNDSTPNIEHLASLANISIDKAQQTLLRKELSNILAMIDSLTTVNTENIAPLAHALDQTQPLLEQTTPLRADVVLEKNQRDNFQLNAPQIEDGLYIVPQFMETE